METNTQSRLFDIHDDLAGRELAVQVEILWISGRTWHDATRIASWLGITEAEVLKHVEGITR